VKKSRLKKLREKGKIWRERRGGGGRGEKGEGIGGLGGVWG